MTDLIDRVITVRASHGVEFNVRLLLQGDRYGRDDGLVVWADGPPGVEFYDRRYPHTRYGQFVSRYYVSTLMQAPKMNGIDLDGGIPDWRIDGSTWRLIEAWLRHITNLGTAMRPD